jgi:hypothetical protein
MATRPGRDATILTAVAITAAVALAAVVLIGITFNATTTRQNKRGFAKTPRSEVLESTDEEDDSVSVVLSSDSESEQLDPDDGSENDLTSEPTQVSVFKRAVATRRARVIRNAGGGDCLFHCFVQAVNLLGHEDKNFLATTVAELRRAVSDSMTEQMLADLRSLYNGAVEARDAILVRDYAFMDGVDTLEQLRVAMQTPRYWGDEMALPVLERVTGLCVIVVIFNGTRYSVAARLDGKDATGKKTIFVRLRNQHYELLEFDGRVVFDSASLKPRRDVAGASSEA